MKHLILMLSIIFIYSGCKQQTQENHSSARDGFYEVKFLCGDSIFTPAPGQLALSFDTLFNPGEYSRVVVDTIDFVPLELETAPKTAQQTEHKKLLSITLGNEAAGKMKAFTAKRIMKQAVIVLDGKAITMHKIRDTIKGPDMQITRCDDNACEYLYVKMKNKMK